MVVERLSTIFGKEQGETPEAERLHEQLLQTLTKEQRCLLLHLIDKKTWSGGWHRNRTLRQGGHLGLRLGLEVFRCDEEESCR